MQAHVFALVIVDLHRNFRLGLPFGYLDVGLNDVVILARRHTLGKLAATIRDQLPLGLRVGRATDGDGNPNRRTVVRSPDCAIDQGVILRWLLTLLGGRGRRRWRRTQACKEQAQDSERTSALAETCKRGHLLLFFLVFRILVVV